MILALLIFTQSQIAKSKRIILKQNTETDRAINNERTTHPAGPSRSSVGAPTFALMIWCVSSIVDAAAAAAAAAADAKEVNSA